MQTGWTIILIKKLKKNSSPVSCEAQKHIPLFMFPCTWTGLITMVWQTMTIPMGVMDDEELEGDHRRFFIPIFLLLFFPLILSLFNVSFCLKATTGFIYLLFKFQVDRKKTLRMMKATTLTFRNKIKTYPTWLTLRNKIK